MKFIYRPNNEYAPNFAIGLDDFAGTGYFTREYIVLTQDYNNIKFNLGLGWGKFAGDDSFKNPLSKISDGFLKRPDRSDNFKLGGSPSYDQWFRGETSYFGGIEYPIKLIKGLNFKIEYDPYDYFDFSASNRSDTLFDLREKQSDVNYGFGYQVNDFFSIEVSYIKGNTFNISFNTSISLNKNYYEKNKFKPAITKDNDLNTKDSFYIDLLTNLNNNKLLLQTSTLDENNNLDIAISTSEHRNAIRSSSYASYIANKVAKLNNIDLSIINITHINVGVELNKISYVANYLDDETLIPKEVKIRNSRLAPGNLQSYKNADFRPNVNFPIIFSSFSPSITSHIGNPEKFYFGGINLKHTSEIQFKRNLLLSTEIIQPIYSNFRDTVSGSDSLMEHVRTDLVQYLKEDDISIARMQVDYIWSPYQNMFSKLSGGIFESMYAGIGGEFLYKPFDKNFTFGFDLFYVKQRTFKQRFELQKYSTVTGHLNFGYLFNSGIEANLSFGRYLAKDDGYTLDLGRSTLSGFKAGIYFTRTNVSAETFGEGSFDKGFYFQIPMDFFNKSYTGNYSTFKLAPLTRDGGAKLIHDKDLRGLIYNSTRHELYNQWNGFLN